MNRITDEHLEAKVDTVNRLMGIEVPTPYSTNNAVHLYKAYGSVAVHAYVGPHGGSSDLSTLGTKREAANFLDGMIKAIRLYTQGA